VEFLNPARAGILGTEGLNGTDPKAYLMAVLNRINNTKPYDVSSLLPWNIYPTDPQVAEAI